MPSLTLSRRAKIALWAVGILIVLLIVAVKLTGVYVNWLWFGEIGHRQVYSSIVWTRVILFAIFGIGVALIIAGNVAIAYLLRPPFRPMSTEQQNLERYRVMLEPRRRWLVALIAAIALLSAGMSAQGRWATWLLWLNGGSFGRSDPQFHKDISFYAWDLPAYRMLLGYGFTAVLFALFCSLVVHYIFGAIRFQTPGPKITLAARRHLTILVFAFMVLKALAYWLDRYGLVFSQRSSFTGASYTDVHAVLSAKTILFWLAVIIAVGVLASMWLRSAILPGIGFIVLMVLSVLIGGIYPAIFEQVSVKPNASTKEAPYIKYNIAATRQAYGVVTNTDGGTVTYKPYAATSDPSTAALRTANATVDNIRILDPNVVSPTFAQQQAQLNNFYGFPAKLDVERYTVDGVTRDYVVGVRELDESKLSGDQTNWINKHTTYTHGYGFVAARADQDVTATRVYADGDIPPSGPLNKAVPLTQPSVYYGELADDYVIVGAEGAPQEFNGNGAKKVTYRGAGGISLSNPLTKLAFAVQYAQTNFLLNDAVGAKGAKILINRDPRQRVQKVAPFLRVDGDPYPIVDKNSGHIVWMVDAYTTMNDYPYSERESFANLASDSLTQGNRTAGQPNSEINYIRNSVKATVDAYDGTVHLYSWDSSDPVLKAWKKAFPGLVQPKSQMPKDVLEHVRYPEDLFEVQRSMLEMYHMNNPIDFYNVAHKWTVPSDPYAPGEQPPYYVLAAAQDTPGGAAEFQLTSPMKVNKKTNLAAYISVDCNPGKGYGKMTVLEVPSGSVIQGPEQVANSFQTNTVISSDITLLGTGQSEVVHGNLLTLPVGRGFLYVEPLYVQGSGNGYPIMKRVLVAYGDKIGYGNSLADALSDLLPGHTTGQTLSTTASGNGSTGSKPGSSTPPPSGSTSASPSPSTTPTQTARPPGSQQALLKQLDQAYVQLQDAYKTGNPAVIGEAQQKVNELVVKYLKAAGLSTSSATASSSSGPAPARGP
jgi:uncharacterized membrane protein (UPF0182 family)